MAINPRNANPLAVYYLLEGATSLLFHIVVTLYVVYYATVVQLDPLQIVLIGTLFEVTIFLFEIPTGVVADVYSRRLSIILGVGITGVGLLIEGIFPIFAAILIAQLLSGIGATLMSGAIQAWITDEIGVERASSAFLRAAQIRILCGMIGIVMSTILGSISLNLPFIVGGMLFMGLAMLLTVVMTENGFQPTPQDERTTWQTMRATFSEGFGLVRIRPVLFFILAIEFVFAFHTEGFDLLWQKHILDNFALPTLITPVMWFGVIAFGANILSLLLSEGVRRRTDHQHIIVILRTIYAMISAAMLIFVLAGNFYVAMFAYWMIAALRTTARPINEAWLNQNIEPHIRATMFSMMGQIGSFGEMLGGTPIGAIGRTFSLQAALVTSAGVLMLTFPLFMAMIRCKVEEVSS
jgi:MFS transporter, DHA3 family, tetracycline resistance protein